MKNAYIRILETELMPAMGCTEPIAIAYAGAVARKVLGNVPEKVLVRCSGNIIKNVKGVIVPSTKDMRGIETSALLGVLWGNPDDKLEVLKGITEEQVATMVQYLEKGICSVELAAGVENLYIDMIVSDGAHCAEVVISQWHTNIVKVARDGQSILESESESFHDFEEEEKIMDLKGIYDFAREGDIAELIPYIDRQIQYNKAISEEGIKNQYGANVGKSILKHRHHEIREVAKAYAAAGSDARMAGCELPVVINSGSGNQGITVSVPVVKYAEYLGVSDEKLYRALILSNLVAIHIKRGIGKLSAFCGVVGAACGAGAGIGFLYDDSFDVISNSVINTLGNVSGIVCDGAKASCAAKIASALDASIMARELAIDGSRFQDGEGLVEESAEETIENIWRLGKEGMKNTDTEILNMMISN